MVQTEAALARWGEVDAKLLIHIHDELVWEVQAEHTRAFSGECCTLYVVLLKKGNYYGNKHHRV